MFDRRCVDFIHTIHTDPGATGVRSLDVDQLDATEPLAVRAAA